MLQNYLNMAVRQALRQPVFFLINIAGLVLGLACSIFIFLWILDEWSFNRYHPHNDRVYKVMENLYYSDGTVETDQYTPGIVKDVLVRDYAEVEQACRLKWSDVKLLKAGDAMHYEYGSYADGTVFEVLNVPILQGDPRNTLPDDRSIALSRETAARYFKNGDALGQTLRMNNQVDLTVTAVFEDLPENVTEDFKFILPLNVYIREENVKVTDWHNDGWLVTLVKLKDRATQAAMDKKIKGLIRKNNPEFPADIFLFAMTDWRLYGDFENGVQHGGRIRYIYSFSLVALFILVIACINFMNLSTARAANRSREVGIRKVAGATRHSLMRQFITESVLLCFLSLCLALLIVHIGLPLFNNFTGKTLAIHYGDLRFSGALLGIALATGLLAGSYPAFVLSSFRPAAALKGAVLPAAGSTALRKGLVVFQFALSMIIIVGALVVSDQINFMRDMQLGFDKDNVLAININPGVYKNYAAFRNDLLQQPVIQAVGMGAASPMEINGVVNVEWDGKPDTDDTHFNIANGDYNYIPTLGFTLIAGRNFSPDHASDSNNFIVTEGVVKQIGWKNAIGQHLRWEGVDGQVIGVIRDFHNLGIREAFQPTVLTLGKSEADFGRWASVFVRYTPGKAAEALERTRALYKKHHPEFPIQFHFIDEEFEHQVRTERMAAVLSQYFTGMAMVISGMGLFGLTLYSTGRRAKEIGIRKVFGATVPKLLVLLCGDYMRLIVYGILVGCPVAYYFTQQFLSIYPYRTQPQAWMFLVPAALVLLLAVCIVSYQSVKTALRNPVDVMRHE